LRYMHGEKQLPEGLLPLNVRKLSAKIFSYGKNLFS